MSRDGELASRPQLSLHSLFSQELKPVTSEKLNYVRPLFSARIILLETITHGNVKKSKEGSDHDNFWNVNEVLSQVPSPTESRDNQPIKRAVTEFPA